MRLQADSEIVIGHETIRLRRRLGLPFASSKNIMAFTTSSTLLLVAVVSALSDVIKRGLRIIFSPYRLPRFLLRR